MNKYNLQVSDFIMIDDTLHIWNENDYAKYSTGDYFNFKDVPLTRNIMESNFEKKEHKIENETSDIFISHYVVENIYTRDINDAHIEITNDNMRVWSSGWNSQDPMNCDYLFPVPKTVREMQHYIRVCSTDENSLDDFAYGFIVHLNNF